MKYLLLISVLLNGFFIWFIKDADGIVEFARHGVMIISFAAAAVLISAAGVSAFEYLQNNRWTNKTKQAKSEYAEVQKLLKPAKDELAQVNGKLPVAKGELEEVTTKKESEQKELDRIEKLLRGGIQKKVVEEFNPIIEAAKKADEKIRESETAKAQADTAKEKAEAAINQLRSYEKSVETHVNNLKSEAEDAIRIRDAARQETAAARRETEAEQRKRDSLIIEYAKAFDDFVPYIPLYPTSESRGERGNHTWSRQ